MALLSPSIFVNMVTDIDVSLLKNMEIEVIFLDVDDTIVPHDSYHLSSNILKWINILKSAGFKIIIVSNNFKKRVSKIAKYLSLPFLANSCKPLPAFYFLARHKFKIKNPADRCLIIGDQLFTDILAGNICQIKSALVEPLKNKNVNCLIKCKRAVENRIKKKFKLKYK